MMATAEHVARAWVGCLGCYNGGTLRGEWLEVDGLEDDDVIAGLCPDPSHEERWVFDHEGLATSGEMSPAEAASRARAVADLLECAERVGIPAAVALEYADDSNAPPEAWPDLEAAFRCSAEDETDYVLQELENSGTEVPSWLQIDYRGTFEDMTSGMPVYRHDGMLWVFYE